MTEKPLNNGGKAEKPILRGENGQILPGSGAINPAGKPKGSKHITTLLIEALKQKAENGSTYEELFIKRILNEAIIKGKGDMMKHAWDHIDGTPSQAIDLTSNGESITTSGEDVMKMAAEIQERLRKQKTDND